MGNRLTARESIWDLKQYMESAPEQENMYGDEELHSKLYWAVAKDLLDETEREQRLNRRRKTAKSSRS